MNEYRRLAAERHKRHLEKQKALERKETAAEKASKPKKTVVEEKKHSNEDVRNETTQDIKSNQPDEKVASCLGIPLPDAVVSEFYASAIMAALQEKEEKQRLAKEAAEAEALAEAEREKARLEAIAAAEAERLEALEVYEEPETNPKVVFFC
jgi:hypothetical protein